MTDHELDKERISGLLDQLGNRLVGQWLLVGGALVSIWVEPRRVTEDIALVGLTGATNERFALMDAVFSLGLPVEAVNSAADFFMRNRWQRQQYRQRQFPVVPSSAAHDWVLIGSRRRGKPCEPRRPIRAFSLPTRP